MESTKILFSINYKSKIKYDNGIKVVLYYQKGNVIYLKQKVFTTKENGPAEIIELKEYTNANQK